MSEPIVSPVAYAPAAESVEADPAQRSQAMLAHVLGLFSILGTGIYYLVKKNDPKAGPFVQDQMREAFNFHLAAFAASLALNIVTAVVVGVTHSTILGLVCSLAGLALWVGVLVLLVLSAVKANKGIAARYPVKIQALK